MIKPLGIQWIKYPEKNGKCILEYKTDSYKDINNFIEFLCNSEEMKDVIFEIKSLIAYCTNIITIVVISKRKKDIDIILSKFIKNYNEKNKQHELIK